MGRRDFFEQEKRKKMVTTFALAIGLAIVACVTIFVMYSQKLNEEAENNLFALTEDEQNVVPNDELQETSYSKDKTVPSNNSVVNEVKAENKSVIQNIVKSPENKEPVPAVVKEPENTVEEQKVDIPKKAEPEIQEQIIEEEPNFQAPVAGDIIKDFAMDTLVYSETLDEWCTHSGIDIRADKASVVMASEKGKVESIKNETVRQNELGPSE